MPSPFRHQNFVLRLVDISSHSASDTLIGAVPVMALMCGVAPLVTVGLTRELAS